MCGEKVPKGLKNSPKWCKIASSDHPESEGHKRKDGFLFGGPDFLCSGGGMIVPKEKLINSEIIF